MNRADVHLVCRLCWAPGDARKATLGVQFCLGTAISAVVKPSAFDGLQVMRILFLLALVCTKLSMTLFRTGAKTRSTPSGPEK